MVDVFAWGNNNSGELGIPVSKGKECPIPIRSQVISKLRPVMIQAGHDKTYVLSQNGQVNKIYDVKLISRLD